MPRRAAIVLCALAIAGAAGCGEGSGGSIAPGGFERREPNATDAAFVRAMVPHQAGGVAVAQVAERRAKRPELRAIGAEIAKRQGPTVARLRELAPDVARQARAGAVLARPAPVSPSRLRDPVSFDHEFLSMMIRHHEDSIRMADEERDRGGDDRVKRVAAEIFESQKSELEKLRRFMRTWYGVDGYDGGGGGAPGGSSPDT